jgi:cyclic pyranopterin phosphate synthase
MDYEIIGGRIVTWALEAHVVDHCNLRCAQCCTLSPWLPDRFVDPGQLERDLTSASRVLAPAVFKLTGGEPSLHPNLVECIEAARASKISPVLSMSTNGWLAPRLPDRVFQLLDRITLSVYASAPLPARTLAHVESRCRAHDVRLTIKPIGVFQEITPASPGDEEQARRVYASCWLRARCHTIHGGRFYPCTRPPHLASVLNGRGIDAGPWEGDGVELAGEDWATRRAVLALLRRTDALASCRWCLGSTGGWMAHRQA